ncbi:type I-E CRISPR-associated protein Cse2/CasB [Streptomyces sp. NPDC000594]|uniref:type I-E CRISPR-associated protein Cse2/CasB n=1 Tax=Streptomyces sp. NPDC000594 TaxID=3154261 RepID=UPI0033175F78
MTAGTSARQGARTRRALFWESFNPGQPYAAADLAALRAGVGREPGSLPRPLHRVQVSDADGTAGMVPVSFAAEHAALTLFGVHQQGQARPVHRPDTGLGDACRALRRSGRASPLAVDRRLDALAGSLDGDELAQHLRALVQLLRGAGIGLDYTRLFFDLRAWQLTEAERGQRVRAWGLQYTDLARTDSSGPGPLPGTPAAEGPYWEVHDPGAATSGAVLAALRSGAGREAGTVPAMWTLHRAGASPYEQATGASGDRLAVEHTALVLFGLHQQGQRKAMHTPGVGLGKACGRLRTTDRVGSEALARRFGNILTSVDSHELAQHLRGLIPLLRTAGQPLDYGLLQRDLTRWDQADEQPRVRGRWDRAFHSPSASPA